MVIHLERNWITNPLWVTTFLFRQLAVFIEHFALKCTHPVVIKWWISLEFQPVALYAINKYSFSYYPSSGISSSIMVEITAVKAVYALLFSSTWFGRYLWNYWSVEVAAAGGSWALALFYFCASKNPLARARSPRASLFCFSFQNTHKSLHWSQLSCENKNDPKLFKNYSGTISVFDMSERSKDRRSGRLHSMRGKNPLGVEVIPLPALSGKGLCVPCLVT